MIRATLAAPPGTPAQASGIGVFLPRQENLTGIIVPAANAGLRTVIAAALDGVAGPAAVLAAGPDPVDPRPDPPQAASRRPASTVSAPAAAWPRLNEH